MLKEVFDRSMALFGIILFMPLMLILAILISIRMPGDSVLFRQKRVGRKGKLFTMVKFRTMVPNHSGSSVSVAGDVRITPLGAILRRYKLDELPELWNVLCGDMSFVGPRPDVPGYADKLSGKERIILELKPGITGPATLKYRNEEQLLATFPDPTRYNDEVIFPDKVKINLKYFYNHSFMGDLKIIVQTFLPSSF